MLTSRPCHNPFITLNGYIDDHSVKKDFKANSKDEEKNTKVAPETCMDNIREWMDMNKLKMNASKTEFILQTEQISQKQNLNFE